MAIEWEWLETKKQEWRDMDPKFRYLLIAVTVGGIALIAWQRITHPAAPTSPAAALPAQPLVAGAPAAPVAASAPGFSAVVNSVLPTSPRNQGLEDLTAEIDGLKKEIHDMKAQGGLAGSGPGTSAGMTGPFRAGPATAPPLSGTAAQSANPLGKDLPEAVSFDQPGAKSSSGAKATPVAAAPDVGASAVQPPPEPPARPTMVADPAPPQQSAASDQRPDLVIPMYTGIEAVMLSGVNARPSGSNGGGAAGSVTSALDVGAPFVSRVKGLAIMPNSWKAGDLENCFVGGSATAVLSAERAYAIADHISCIFKNGDVYEAPMKAYALDVDGTLGLAGKVVNKQGAMLMQAALTGMAAGLGAALAPSSVPSYNTNVGSGSEQSYTYPSPSYLAGTAVGQGVNHAATELSQFYLNFAKETFPVVEVTAGTRVTWILKEDIVLKKRQTNKEAG
ncbi:TraB/VirB10 family protein [Burkholderia multivorans]|uniref:TraB/VirB10 family protein n=1 Tax=Burkholderia multivorans TaxID=87883 RepID=UPI0015887CEE|nr:TraB/VirB10 family protein [Burkholderia multivorans]MDN8102584.1 TraB/VirB10 family protein [Burkholderia multivorans]